MTLNGWMQILFFFAVVLLVTKPVGIFMARVFSRESTWLDLVLRPIEKVIYKLTAVNEEHEMRWTEYSIAILLFSGVSMLVLYLIERTQQWLPLNPQKFAAVSNFCGFKGSHCCVRSIKYNTSMETPLKSSMAMEYSVQRISCSSFTAVSL